MASVTNYPATGQTLSTGVAWTTPENIVSDNVSYAYRSSSGNSAQLTGTNFGFSIPSDATINGIVFEIEAHDTQPASGAVFNTVQLKKSSGAVGSNLAASTTFPDTLTVVSFGSSTELWGTTWTPVEINDSTFGAYMIATKPNTSGDHYIDFFRITVYYTEATTTSTTTSTSTSTTTTSTSTTSTSTTITVTSTTISTSTTTSTSSSTSTTTTTLLLDFIPKMERISFRLVQ